MMVDCILVILVVVISSGRYSSFAQNEKYRAKLDEDNEVPTVNTTPEGVINFKSKDGSMSWKMNITGITLTTKIYGGIS